MLGHTNTAVGDYRYWDRNSDGVVTINEVMLSCIIHNE